MNINGRAFPGSLRSATTPFPPIPSPYLLEDPPRPDPGTVLESSLYARRRMWFDEWARNILYTVVATYANVGLLLATHETILPVDPVLKNRVDACLAALSPDEKRVLGIVGAQFNTTADALTCAPMVKLMWGHLVSPDERFVLNEMLRLSLKSLKPEHMTEDVLLDFFSIDEQDIEALDHDHKIWSRLVRSTCFELDTIMVSHGEALLFEIKPLTSGEATLQAAG